MSAFLRKYGTGTGADVIIPMIKRGLVDQALGADWTPAAGDVKLSINGGAAANIGTLPTAIAMGNGAAWKFVFADAELQGKTIVGCISDSATKVVEDQFFIIETYGHASAMYQADLSAANLPANMIQLGSSTQSATDLKDFADTGYDPVSHKVAEVAALTGHTVQTGDSYPIVNSGTHGNAALKSLIDAVSSSITGLNNLSALSNLYGSPLLEIPDSGDPDADYAFTLVVRDNEGKLVALDGSPTITASNAAGTDRSANLSAVSNPATGRYTFTYSVADDATPESLRITCSGTVSAEARYIEWVGAVVDYDTLTTLLAVKAKTDNLPADPASASTVASAFDALQDISTSDILAALGTAGGLDAALALLATASTLNLVKAKTDLIPASPAAVGDIPTLSQIFTTVLTESYRATGAAPTLAQFVFEVLGHLTNSDIVDTLKTIYKLDKTTSAKTATLTIDGSGNPTAIEETT